MNGGLRVGFVREAVCEMAAVSSSHSEPPCTSTDRLVTMETAAARSWAVWIKEAGGCVASPGPEMSENIHCNQNVGRRAPGEACVVWVGGGVQSSRGLGWGALGSSRRRRRSCVGASAFDQRRPHHRGNGTRPKSADLQICVPLVFLPSTSL